MKITEKKKRWWDSPSFLGDYEARCLLLASAPSLSWVASPITSGSFSKCSFVLSQSHGSTWWPHSRGEQTLDSPSRSLISSLGIISRKGGCQIHQWGQTTAKLEITKCHCLPACLLSLGRVPGAKDRRWRERGDCMCWTPASAPEAPRSWVSNTVTEGSHYLRLTWYSSGERPRAKPQPLGQQMELSSLSNEGGLTWGQVLGHFDCGSGVFRNQCLSNFLSGSLHPRAGFLCDNWLV